MLVQKPIADFAPVNARILESVSAKVIMAAVELKLFDRLAGGAVSLSELADGMGVMADRLEPVLDMLVAVDLLERAGETYRNTPVASEFLVSDAPLYQGKTMALNMRFVVSIEDSIVDLLSGGDVDRSKADAGWGAAEIMDGTAQNAKVTGLLPVVDFITALPGFDGFRTMCDIGGNHGLYTMAVLERNAAMLGTIYDLPPVVKQSKLRCEQMGFGNRVMTKGIDFREETLSEGQFDLAFTSDLLYAFKSDLGAIMKKISHGLKPGGWFVSHHACDRIGAGRELYKASLELVTRLAGYESHFIEREELKEALESAGFGEPLFHPVPGTVGLLTAAQKLV